MNFFMPPLERLLAFLDRRWQMEASFLRYLPAVFARNYGDCSVLNVVQVEDTGNK